MNRVSPLIGFFLLLSLALPAHALQMDPLSIEQLAEQSAVIVRGTVRSKSCQRDPAGRIYTRVELQIAEAWKGAMITNRFCIVQGGGILGDRKTVVSGQVEYDIGEEVVAFLVLNQRGEGVTLGLSQGKFHLWKDPASGEYLARNPFHGGVDGAESGLEPHRRAVPSRLTVAELKRRVHGGAR
jgi:hypothetical protein